MKYKAHKHHKKMIKFLTETPRAALFAGMGLGKTGATLKAFTKLKKKGKVKAMLIVAPLRVSVLTWMDEVAKWDHTKKLKIVTLRTEEGKQAFRDGSADIYTINYDSLPKMLSELFYRRKKLPVDLIVFDELDNAKNPESVRISAMRKYIHKFKRRWGMTGTPVSNNHLDLFAQIRLLDGGERFGVAFTSWRDRYFVNTTPYRTFPTYEIHPLVEENGLLESKIADMSLVLRSCDYLDIPPTTFLDIPVKLPPKAMRRYKELEKELITRFEKTKDEEDTEAVAANNAVLVNKLLQVTSGTVYATEETNPSERTVEFIHDKKIKALKALAKKHRKEPMLVFCHFIHEREEILKAFPYAETFKEDSLKRWNAGKIPMIVAHPKSIGHGLNLQEGGRIATWFSIGYSRALYDQSNARLARFGQKKETIIYRLICEGLIDDAVIAALENKDKKSTVFLNTIKNIRRLAKTR